MLQKVQFKVKKKKKKFSSTSVVNEAKECNSPEASLCGFKQTQKSSEEETVSVKPCCKVSTSEQICMNVVTRFGKKRQKDRDIWQETLYWRNSEHKKGHSKVWQSADRSRGSVQMTGQVPWATVWQEWSQAPSCPQNTRSVLWQVQSPHTST